MRTAQTKTIISMDLKDSTRESYYTIKISPRASSSKIKVSIFHCKECYLKIPQAILVNHPRIKLLTCNYPVQGSSLGFKKIYSWIEEVVQSHITISQIHSRIIKVLKMEWLPARIFLIKQLWWQLCLQISILPLLSLVNSTPKSLLCAQVCGWRPIIQTLRSS